MFGCRITQKGLIHRTQLISGICWVRSLSVKEMREQEKLALLKKFSDEAQLVKTRERNWGST